MFIFKYVSAIREPNGGNYCRLYKVRIDRERKARYLEAQLCMSQAVADLYSAITLTPIQISSNTVVNTFSFTAQSLHRTKLHIAYSLPLGFATKNRNNIKDA